MHWMSSAANARLITALLTCVLSLAGCGGAGSDSVDPLAQNATAGSAIALSAATYSVGQSAGSVSVVVTRTGDTTGAATVKYASANQTAVAGSDYTSVSGTLSWTAGDTSSKTITVPVNGTTPFSGAKTFTVALSEPSSSASVAPPASATVSIAGTGAASSGTVGKLQFSAATYSVQQGNGEFTVAVNRTGGTAGAIAVSYSTTDGTAAAGTDYTAASGELAWMDGDSATKTFAVDINDAAGFSGTKTFAVALANPSGGAQLANPSSATVTITGSGASGQPPTSGSGGPSAVSNLQLINQGGASNDSNPATNIQQISWTKATAGANPISYYRIYRNGTAYATTTALTYTDKAATNSNDPTWAKAATIYSYNVSAVDSAGTEGPKAAQMSVYSYQNGKSNWGNDDLSFGSITQNYSSTAGNPQGGTYDISVAYVAGGFQPTAHSPQAPLWDLEIGAFNYFVVDINPGPVVHNNMTFGTVSRVPPGDVYGWHPGVNVFDYGPAPKANTWATYKIPLSIVAMGACQFTGSISGSTLTVTGIVSGQPLVDAGGFVTGPGVPAGTYIVAYGQHSAIGTFTLAGPGVNGNLKVASTTLTYQRTSLYKFALSTDSANMTMYYNNLGFTVN